MNQKIFADNLKLSLYSLEKYQFLHDFSHIFIVNRLSNFYRIDTLLYIILTILYLYLNYKYFILYIILIHLICKKKNNLENN